MATRNALKKLSRETLYDGVNMLLGAELGSGSTRTVFVNDLNPTQVVKIARNYSEKHHANVMEWEIWKELVYLESPLMKYFAPCRHISPDSRMLIMDRTQQPMFFPRWVPKCFSDLKLTNFGQLADGRFVCHDYGMLNLAAGLEMRFVKANWWQLEGIPELVLPV